MVRYLLKSRVFFLVAVFLILGSVIFALKVPIRGRVYNCSALNIRTGPGTSYAPPLGTLSPGTIVEILSRSGSWYKVNTGQYQGRYVYTGYIDVTDFDELEDDQAAQRPHAALSETDPQRQETRNFDARVVPIAVD